MPDPSELIRQAELAERLAKAVSYGRDRDLLLEQAARLRQEAEEAARRAQTR